MNNCGSCCHYRESREHGFMCDKTGKPAGFLEVKECFETTPSTPKEIATKVCRRCHKELPVSEFNRHSRSRDGYQPFCKDCQKEVFHAHGKKKTPARKDVFSIEDLDDDDLFQELRRRGYTGTIFIRKEVNL